MPPSHESPSSPGHGAAGPVAEHRARGRAARCRILTVSDTRTLETDEGGKRAAALLEAGGHTVVDRRIVPDDRATLAVALREALADTATDAVILTGGTGVAPRDVTVETVSDFLEKPLDGFGELFRMLSFEQIGSAAMLSRAVGGVARRKAIFALPGSRKAVELAVERLIAPELGHLLALIAP